MEVLGVQGVRYHTISVISLELTIESLSGQPLHSIEEERVHIYDTWSNVLTETRRIPSTSRSVFQDLYDISHDQRSDEALRIAEEAFSSLEFEVEATLMVLLDVMSSSDLSTKKRSRLDWHTTNTLRRFFVFLRYRNSELYRANLAVLRSTPHNIRHRIYFDSIVAFLKLCPPDSAFVAHTDLKRSCWNLCQAEISIGLASEDQEYILTDRCFGTLGEDLDGNDS